MANIAASRLIVLLCYPRGGPVVGAKCNLDSFGFLVDLGKSESAVRPQRRRPKWTFFPNEDGRTAERTVIGLPTVNAHHRAVAKRAWAAIYPILVNNPFLGEMREQKPSL